METRTFTNAWSPVLTWGYSAAFAIGALLMGFEVTWWAGLGVALIGLAAIGALAYFGTRTTVVCTDVTVTVTATSRCRGTNIKRFAWRDVTTTKYREDRMSAVGHDRTIGTFTVSGAGGELLTASSNDRDFKDLVELFNERTTHLPYVWLRAADAKSSNVIESAGAYCRVARPRVAQAIDF